MSSVWGLGSVACVRTCHCGSGSAVLPADERFVWYEALQKRSPPARFTLDVMRFACGTGQRALGRM